MSEKASVWSNGQNKLQVTIPDYENVTRISVNKTVTDLTPVDNFYPSIKSLYKEIDSTAEFPGKYLIEGYSIELFIEPKDGLYYVNIPYMSISSIIYPVDKLQFISIDGSMKITFNLDEKGVCKSLDAEWNGNYHGVKIE